LIARAVVGGIRSGGLAFSHCPFFERKFVFS
jgi:hypothetical protein